MNIIILHLSDLHISNKEVVHMDKCSKLVDSLNIFNPFDGVILALSGDIANSGNENEYKLATRFIGSILSQIKEIFKVKDNNLHVILVPGNHDIYKKDAVMFDRDSIINMHKKGEIDTKIDTYLEMMKPFFSFANNQKCYLDKNSLLLDRRLLTFATKKESVNFETNLINSAIFSSSDDKGVHYLPDSFFDIFSEKKPCTYSLTMMHHSPDWFSNSIKNKLSKNINQVSHFVLYGHEHYEHAGQISSGDDCTVTQAGGAWWHNSFEESSYIAGCLNTDSNEYHYNEFLWDNKQNFYSHGEQKTAKIQEKFFSTTGLVPNEEFIKNTIASETNLKCSDIRKFFIFPSLKIETNDDYDDDSNIDNMHELLEFIKKEEEVVIYSTGVSGKTMFSKMLFMELVNDFLVILCKSGDLKDKMQKNAIRNLFSDIYGHENFTYFEQVDKTKKVLIIDDFDLISEKSWSKFSIGLNEQFAHIILIGDKNRFDDFDIKERIIKNMRKEKITELALSKFYTNNRISLISKLVDFSINDSFLNKETIKIEIEKKLSSFSLGYCLDPDFIVKFTVYYCENASDMQMTNNNIFSTIFEASIETAVKAHIESESHGEILVALHEIAYYIHSNKVYPISSVDIEKIINKYAENYDVSLRIDRFIQIATESGMIIPVKGTLNYEFKNKDHLAYFISKAIILHFNEDSKDVVDILNEIIKCSCFSINSTILKFLVYTTSNIFLKNRVLI